MAGGSISGQKSLRFDEIPPFSGGWGSWGSGTRAGQRVPLEGLPSVPAVHCVRLSESSRDYITSRSLARPTYSEQKAKTPKYWRCLILTINPLRCKVSYLKRIIIRTLGHLKAWVTEKFELKNFDGCVLRSWGRISCPTSRWYVPTRAARSPSPKLESGAPRWIAPDWRNFLMPRKPNPLAWEFRAGYSVHDHHAQAHPPKVFNSIYGFNHNYYQHKHKGTLWISVTSIPDLPFALGEWIKGAS